MINKMSEEHKVAVRNIRRDSNETLKDLKREGDISEDEAFKAQDQVRKFTDDHINLVDQITKERERRSELSPVGPLVQKFDPEKMPAHVAIIMDGNGRWAKQRLLNRVQGHEKGAQTVRTIVRASREIGISHLTLYAFSTENWQRPKIEVQALMKLLERFLESEQEELVENDIRLNTIGETERLTTGAREALTRVMHLTETNKAMTLHLALSYGSRSKLSAWCNCWRKRCAAERSILGTSRKISLPSTCIPKKYPIRIF